MSDNSEAGPFKDRPRLNAETREFRHHSAAYRLTKSRSDAV